MVNRDEAPERLLLVVAHVGQPGHYLLASWPDWPHPSLLAISPPHAVEGLDAAAGAALRDSFGVMLEGPVQRGEERWPVRMAHPRFGGEGVGWLRALAARASGEPSPGPLIEGVTMLERSAAEAGLSTDVERLVFAAGLRMLEA